MPLDTGRFISLAEAADLFGISRTHLNLLARTGKIAAVKIGRNWVTTAEAVSAYLGDMGQRSKDPYKYRRSEE